MLRLDFRIIKALIGAGCNTQIKDVCGFSADDYLELLLQKQTLSKAEISVLSVGLRLIKSSATPETASHQVEDDNNDQINTSALC